MLAEIRGSGLDLSEEPWRLADDELANIALPTLLVSSEDSPAMFRNVNDRLAAALPLAERATVSGAHLIKSHPSCGRRLPEPLARHCLVARDVAEARGLRRKAPPRFEPLRAFARPLSKRAH